jgi:hypothetical protein
MRKKARAPKGDRTLIKVENVSEEWISKIDLNCNQSDSGGVLLLRKKGVRKNLAWARREWIVQLNASPMLQGLYIGHECSPQSCYSGCCILGNCDKDLFIFRHRTSPKCLKKTVIAKVICFKIEWNYHLIWCNIVKFLSNFIQYCNFPLHTVKFV